ncbi:hypothetical protein ACN47E_004112 [Coniothyrium glycines]
MEGYAWLGFSAVRIHALPISTSINVKQLRYCQRAQHFTQVDGLGILEQIDRDGWDARTGACTYWMRGQARVHTGCEDRRVYILDARTGAWIYILDARTGAGTY